METSPDQSAHLLLSSLCCALALLLPLRFVAATDGYLTMAVWLVVAFAVAALIGVIVPGQNGSSLVPALSTAALFLPAALVALRFVDIGPDHPTAVLMVGLPVAGLASALVPRLSRATPETQGDPVNATEAAGFAAFSAFVCLVVALPILLDHAQDAAAERSEAQSLTSLGIMPLRPDVESLGLHRVDDDKHVFAPKERVGWTSYQLSYSDDGDVDVELGLTGSAVPADPTADCAYEQVTCRESDDGATVRTEPDAPTRVYVDIGGTRLEAELNDPTDLDADDVGRVLANARLVDWEDILRIKAD